MIKPRLTLLALLFFMLAGCYPQVLYVHKKPEEDLKKYDVIQIPDFTQTDSEWVPPDSSGLIPDMLAEKLVQSGKYRLVDRSSKPLNDYDNVLLVKGVVTGYIKGCKYCEMIFMGINDKGKGSVSVWVQLIDQSSGEAITDFGAHGRSKEPGYGRSKYIRVVDLISQQVNNINK